MPDRHRPLGHGFVAFEESIVQRGEPRRGADGVSARLDALTQGQAHRADQAIIPAELALRIERGDLAEAQQLITEIRAKHFQEEGVAQGLLQILQAAGVVGPDGMPVGPPPEDTSGIVVPGSASGASGEIWTPDAEHPGKGDKPAIWTPGME